jgi:hypothetical protein
MIKAVDKQSALIAAFHPPVRLTRTLPSVDEKSDELIEDNHPDRQHECGGLIRHC